MTRLLTRSPILAFMFPFDKKFNDGHDKPVNMPANAKMKPLDDELGWDRVKEIFTLDQNGMPTKELQSITNITLSGIVIGTAIGGMGVTKDTVNNFIANNEATRFISHFDAKRDLQQSVLVNFLRKGGRLGAKLGTFCFLFSSITTCTTAYRGKLAVENYMLGGSVTGLIFKMNMGLRAMLVGTGLGAVLGGFCGGVSVLILKLSGITIDEVLEAQKRWIDSRNNKMRENIKECMSTELPEIKKLYEENRKLQSAQSEDVENENK
ncbi:complex I assembly factor TIMMDC1, mitochondrial [Temnothorax nylanderi]|uniref:complex I assembly factor TIMMDC1, mitochondrial n=1 Tax=Temnothorax nylanderi TaxID=102681 RepID=UPI003A8C420A